MLFAAKGVLRLTKPHSFNFNILVSIEVYVLRLWRLTGDGVTIVSFILRPFSASPETKGLLRMPLLSLLSGSVSWLATLTLPYTRLLFLVFCSFYRIVNASFTGSCEVP